MTNPTPRRGLSSLLNGHTSQPAVPIPHRELTAFFPADGADPALTWYPPAPIVPMHVPPAPMAPPPAPAPTADPVDGPDPRIAVWRDEREVVRRLTSEAAKQLSDRDRERAAQVADPENSHVTLTYSEDERQRLGERIVHDLVAQHVADTIDTGRPAPTPSHERALALAVLDNMFRLGPMQTIVDEPAVENILWTGGYTTVMYGDGRSEQREPVFENEADAINWVQFLAAKAPGGGRPFSPANPALRLNLPGNIRLSAMAWSVNRSISIAVRKHLHKNITITRLVEMEVMPELLGQLLTALTRSGCSLVASGPMGVGKTTLIRALAAELPPETRIGTAELVRELYLHELPGREPYVVSAEAITGGGERNEYTDELKGKFGLHEILQEFVSQQLDRVIVGEVAGREIIALFKAMQMARGSLSTVHAYTCRGAIDRLVTLALEEPGVHERYATRQVAAHIQVIVQMSTFKWRDTDQVLRSRRHISEVAWVEPGENSQPAVTILFRQPTPHTHARFGSLPPQLREHVTAYGFEAATWPTHSLDTPDTADEEVMG